MTSSVVVLRLLEAGRSQLAVPELLINLARRGRRREGREEEEEEDSSQ